MTAIEMTGRAPLAQPTAAVAAAMCLFSWMLAGSESAAGAQRTQQSAPATSASIAPGSYRAVLKSPGGDLPFGFEISREGAQGGWATSSTARSACRSLRSP